MFVRSSGPVEHWGADAMRDIEPRKMLEVPAVPGVAGGAALASSANVWIGHAGVVGVSLSLSLYLSPA